MGMYYWKKVYDIVDVYNESVQCIRKSDVCGGHVQRGPIAKKHIRIYTNLNQTAEILWP
jgi:hypothetical protein